MVHIVQEKVFRLRMVATLLSEGVLANAQAGVDRYHAIDCIPVIAGKTTTK
jgi:hypothetical protein